MQFPNHAGEFLRKKGQQTNQSVFLCLFRDKCSKKCITAATLIQINTTLNQEMLQY